MKKVLVLMVAVTLGLTTVVNAKSFGDINTNASSNLKQEISNLISYPKFAKNDLIEGTVWVKVEVDENSKVQIIYWTATNIELGRYVKHQITDYIVKNNDLEKGKTTDLKFKFKLNTGE